MLGSPNDSVLTSPTVLSLGTVVYYQCDPGLVLNGEGSSICQLEGETGVLNSTVPTCINPSFTSKMTLL